MRITSNRPKIFPPLDRKVAPCLGVDVLLFLACYFFPPTLVEFFPLRLISSILRPYGATHTDSPLPPCPRIESFFISKTGRGDGQSSDRLFSYLSSFFSDVFLFSVLPPFSSRPIVSLGAFPPRTCLLRSVKNFLSVSPRISASSRFAFRLSFPDFTSFPSHLYLRIMISFPPPFFPP